jgi:ABC-type phosphate transport system permease subunit
MDSTNIIEILAYTIPSIITGLLPTFYLIQRSTKHQTLVVAKDHQAATLPLRLQAYELTSWSVLTRLN